jgi:hypothetical protein
MNSLIAGSKDTYENRAMNLDAHIITHHDAFRATLLLLPRYLLHGSQPSAAENCRVVSTKNKASVSWPANIHKLRCLPTGHVANVICNDSIWHSANMIDHHNCCD